MGLDTQLVPEVIYTQHMTQQVGAWRNLIMPPQPQFAKTQIWASGETTAAKTIIHVCLDCTLLLEEVKLRKQESTLRRLQHN